MVKDPVKDWLEVYMPKKATAISINSPLEAIEHSLNKWYGLTPSVLRHFELITRGNCLYSVRRDGRSSSAPVYGASNCSLCVKYLTPPDGRLCSKCPIFIKTGRRCSAAGSQYEAAVAPSVHWKSDVGPMIRLLEDLRYEYAEKGV